MSITDPLEDELESLGTSFGVQVTADGAVALGLLRQLRGGRDRWPGESGDHDDAPIVALPDGALVRFDGVADHTETRRAIAEELRRLAEEAGLDGDDVTLHDVDGLDDLDECPRAVVLRLFPPPANRGRPLPPAWIDVAAEWVFGDLDPEAVVRLRVLGVELQARVADAAGVLHACATAGAWCDVVTGDITDRIRTASISFGSAPHVAIAGGGPRCDDAGLLARYELLVDVATELADWCAYACVDFEAAFDQLGVGLATSAWTAAGHAPANRVVGDHGDRYVPDAYPFQILGPGHRLRLGDAGVTVEWTQIVDEHRTLQLGDPDDWLVDRASRAGAQSAGWELLRPLLVDHDLGATDAPVPTGDGLMASAGVPDLDDITMEPGSHPRRSTRLSPLELVAWLAGEPHSDRPRAVSPVVGAMLRTLAFGLDGQRRQTLKEIVPDAVRRSTESDDDHLVGLVVDWLVTRQAAAWLRAAGVDGVAGRLVELRTTITDDGARRAVNLLAAALVTANRRLEITTAIAGDSASVESLSWAAWERAAETSGWTAASDAVTIGVPSELSTEVDRRIVDLSRERAAARDSVAGASALCDVAFTELGRIAWARAWDRAEDLVHRETGFSLRTVVRTGLDELLGDDDECDSDLAQDAVDRAASAVLGTMTETASEGDAFAAARDAERGRAGDAWREALAQAGEVIGTDAFADAVDAIRAELDRWTIIEPHVVVRLTTATLAREAAGVAARAVAARTVAETLAQGGSPADADAAAVARLQPVVDVLADSAVDLLRQLVGASSESSAAIA